MLIDDVQRPSKLAQYVLRKVIDVFMVTGSNGKTTTKDMLAQFVRQLPTKPIIITKLAPYTVLHMPEGTEKFVLEMGQDHLGDIHLLRNCAS